MISSQALAALAIATTCVMLTPRASGGGASDGGFTNPFASAFGMIHPGACLTNGFVSSLCISSDTRKSCPLTTGQRAGKRVTPRFTKAGIGTGVTARGRRPPGAHPWVVVLRGTP
jgi:hypothetical protein